MGLNINIVLLNKLKHLKFYIYIYLYENISHTHFPVQFKHTFITGLHSTDFKIQIQVLRQICRSIKPQKCQNVTF